MKKLLALLLAVMMVFAVAGCQKTQNEATPDPSLDTTSKDDILNTAVVPSENVDGVAEIVAVYALTEQIIAGESQTEDLPAGGITLYADGTGTYGPEGSAFDIYWFEEGNTITLTAPSQVTPLVMTVDGDRLSATDGDYVMIFTKQ